MINCLIDTAKYDIDLMKLLSRRLQQHACPCGLSAYQNGVSVSVQEGEGLYPLADALSTILCRDLRYFELARMIDQKPLTLAEKQSALASALEEAACEASLDAVRDDLVAYLQRESRLNLEGYMRFRMQPHLNLWRTHVEKATEDAILQREYTQLLGTLNAYVRALTPRVSELSVCLHPDGSCTLTDDSDACIEYIDCTEDGIVSLLVGMAPARLTVYDLSCGNAIRLIEAIRCVFSDRVKIYR